MSTAATEASGAAAPASAAETKDEEAIFIEKNKAEEEAEKARLAALKAENHTAFVWELRKYVDQINATGPPPVLPDTELRDTVLRSSSPAGRLLDDIYNFTFRHVPYEDAMYICAPEQATLLHLLAKAICARECLDVGTFTGYSAAAVAQALPAKARITGIELREDYAEVAKAFLGSLPVDVDMRVGDALTTLRALAAEGRVFDLIAIDADKQNQQQYYEACLDILRPRGMLVMFGMMLYPTEEDKEAIDSLISLVANDTRVTTTMLPIGCGVQVCTKNDASGLDAVLAQTAMGGAEARRRYALEAELTAIDAALHDAERARDDGGLYTARVPAALSGGLPKVAPKAQAPVAAADVAAASLGEGGEASHGAHDAGASAGGAADGESPGSAGPPPDVSI